MGCSGPNCLRSFLLGECASKLESRIVLRRRAGSAALGVEGGVYIVQVGVAPVRGGELDLVELIEQKYTGQQKKKRQLVGSLKKHMPGSVGAHKVRGARSPYLAKESSTEARTHARMHKPTHACTSSNATR